MYMCVWWGLKLLMPQWTQGIRQYGGQARWACRLYLKFVVFLDLNRDHSLASVVSGNSRLELPLLDGF